MNDEEQMAFHQDCRLTDPLYEKLRNWVNDRYRDTLSVDDLRDPNLIEETRETIKQLCDILDLPSRLLVPES